jgi:hypothetical protein
MSLRRGLATGGILESNNPMNSKIIILSGILVCFLSGIAAGANNNLEKPLLHKVIFGLALHDTGPVGDKNEHGIDPNWELQFNPPDWKVWRWIGSPYTAIGLTPNFNGDTSQFYGGIDYEFSLSNRFTDPLTLDLTKILFVSAFLGPAAHTGALSQPESVCQQENGYCGYGYRILPRFSFELGAYVSKNQGVSVFFDHMSGKGLGSPQYEGLNHSGIRYHYVFNSNF